APSSNGGEAGLFLHTNNNLDAAPNLQFTIVPILYVDPAYAREGPAFTLPFYITLPESRNTNASAIMIGEKAADLIKVGTKLPQ
ncbi:hypothetical protein H6G97_37235, partial [Nostoc flagelliforme FACHB-838]|nr:hypothetical protein [Nostoc flagelliforme FACHB-838]